MAKNRRQTRKKRTNRKRRQVKRLGIDILPDDVLLEIFDIYTEVYGPYGKTEIEEWQSLVHVCRRWRSLVLTSPGRLNLRLCCTPETPVKDKLDLWPALFLIVRGDMALSGADNIIAALGQSNRVSQALLEVAGSQLEEVSAAMQVPFPELINLHLSLNGETVPVIPDSFLDGSAPRLQVLQLSGLPFRGIPKLLFSATHLVRLSLTNIPHSGYISPEAMAALLSVLTSLDFLYLGFESPQSRPRWETQPPPPPKRSILPALLNLQFKGVTEYLEELVTRIDTPQLGFLYITFFNQIDFDCSQLAQFINCTPKLGKHDEAHWRFHEFWQLLFFDNTARVGLPPGPRNLEIVILCNEPDWQLSSIEQVCNFPLHRLSAVEDLCIKCHYSQLVWKNDAIENSLWLQLLLPFTAVKNLYVSEVFALGIAAALQELVGDRIIEVLPSLQSIFVEGPEPSGPFQEYIGQFVAARQLSGHPIAISVR